MCYDFISDRLPSSDPSFAIRCLRALKTVCGRPEIVDRRDDHALISAAGHPRHHRRCHRTTIARRPATRTGGGRTEAQESRTAVGQGEKDARAQRLEHSARHAADWPSTARNDEVDCVAPIGMSRAWREGERLFVAGRVVNRQDPHLSMRY